MNRQITNQSFDWLIKNCICFENIYLTKKGTYQVHFDYNLIKSLTDLNYFEVYIYAIQDDDDNWLYLKIGKGNDFSFVDQVFLDRIENEVIDQLFSDGYHIEENEDMDDDLNHAGCSSREY